MKYLSEMTTEQTLVMLSGHPQGLFPSHPDAPRIVLTNGMMIPNYSTKENYEKLYALGVTMYGQMTAGSYSYIGPQGIVHGTTLTILNAARKYLKREDLSGLVYLSSGLGGMSGAQPKAGDICGVISVTAEVNESALDKRLK
jgi:urocanate hydratase